jgi:hypothetical protein
VRVLVMFIVHVKMIVLEGLVRVDVPVAFTKEAGDSEHHEQASAELTRTEPRARQRNGSQRSDEWRRREERGFAGGAEQSQRVHVEDDADAVAAGAETDRGCNETNRRQGLA